MNYIPGQRVAVQLDPPYDKWRVGYVHTPEPLSVVFDGHKGKATEIHPSLPVITIRNWETHKDEVEKIKLVELKEEWEKLITSHTPVLFADVGDDFLSSVWWYFDYKCFQGKLPWLPVRKTNQGKKNFAVYISSKNLVPGADKIKVNASGSFNFNGLFCTIGHETIHQWQKHTYFRESFIQDRGSKIQKSHGALFEEGIKIVEEHTPFKITMTGDFQNEDEHYRSMERREGSTTIYYIVVQEPDGTIYNWYDTDQLKAFNLFNNYAEFHPDYKLELYESKDKSAMKRIKKGRGRNYYNPSYQPDRMVIEHIRNTSKLIKRSGD